MAKPGSSPIRCSGATSPWEIEDTGWPRARAIVGLYLDPPEHALVLCCDEKTQIPALGRTQPGLPLKRGRGKTMSRLQTQRRDDIVRGTEHAHRPGALDD